uniref:MBL fold metallo-hydrolase n=1 Tax=candidate division CPR3 bacterium TaxID=2268181 RepID=A0A7C4R316_UNCC3
MKLKFHGAAGRVTGSCFLLSTEKENILIDCGLFQGSSDERGKNQEPFPFDPKKIDFVIATHSHVDHIGRIPKLVKEGFRGKIFSTHPAKEFAKIFLEDTYKLIRDQAKRKGEELIWEKEDLLKSINLWEGYNYHQIFNAGSANIEFLDAGHILGSSIVKIVVEGKTFIFSGDLGNPPVPLLEDTEKVGCADYVIMETTYGNRLHEKSEERIGELEKILKEIIQNKSVLLIPIFAMEKTQELLYEINELVEEKRIGRVNFFLDSPLAIKATRIYEKYTHYFDEEAIKKIKSGDDVFDFPGLKITTSGKDSRKIFNEKPPKVIIAGSGMSTGGRILMHEINYLSDPNNVILFVGYQVKGTLGRRIKDGEKTVKISGKEIEINAQIKELSAYSSHADQGKLSDWVKNIVEKSPQKPTVFAVHGEVEASEEFAKIISERFGIKATTPKENEELEL